MEKDSGQIFQELKNDVSAYADLKLDLLKLSTYERTGKIISILSYDLILLFLIFFAILFLFLSLGLFLGDLFGSQGMGFGIVAILYLLLIAIIVANKSKISLKITNIIIAALTANDEKNDTTTDKGQSIDSPGEAAS